MTGENEIRNRLLTLQTELQLRLNRTQSEEYREVEGNKDTTAKLWEVSEIRDDLNDEASKELDEVNRALSRMDDGDYGVCKGCGEPINPKRLEALPYAEFCISCAERK